MGEAALREMSVDEFLIWCLDQEERYELVDGFPVPLRSMAGASDPHDAIVVNLIIQLGNQLKGTGCRPSTADKALRTAIKRVRRPDVTIECSPVTPKTYESRNPIAAFEVLSPTTRKNDRNAKLPEYMRHPSLKAIVLIDPDLMDLLVYTREDGGEWEPARLLDPSDVLRIPGTPIALTLATIYDGVPIDL